MPTQPNQIAEKPLVQNAEASAPSTGAGKGVIWFKDIGGGEIEAFYTDEAGNDVQLTEGLQVKGAGGESNTASNLGTGSEIFAGKVGVDLRFKTLTQGANINLNETLNEIEIVGLGESNTGANLGTGTANVFKTKSGVQLQFRRLKAGADMSVSENGDDIEISYTGAGGGGGEANTASNLPGGDGNVFYAKAGVDLQFRSLKAGANVSITEDSNNITISASSGGTGSPLTIKEKGSDVDTDVTTLDFVGEGHDIESVGAGSVKFNSLEYKFTLPAAASLSDRISASTDIPAGFTVETADTAGEGEFGTSVDTLVMTHGLSDKIAALISVFEITEGEPVGNRITELVQIHTNQGIVRTNTAKTKCAVMELTKNYATNTGKDLIVYVKLI